MKHKCQYCGYEWIARRRKPKSCPYCKRYFPLANLQKVAERRKNRR
jgi:rubrerythrin